MLQKSTAEARSSDEAAADLHWTTGGCGASRLRLNDFTDEVHATRR